LLDLEQALAVLVKKVVHLFVQVANLKLGLEVDLVVFLCVLAVAGGLTVLAHHDDWDPNGIDA
jgi:hypothetical protein